MPIQLGSTTDSAIERAIRHPVPQARAFNSVAISHTTSGTEQVVTFDSERYDSGGLHSTSVNTSRLTAPITGLYSVGACVRFASNATGYRYIYLRLNGTTVLGADIRPAASSVATVVPLMVDYQLTAGDYVEVVANQLSGGALNMETGSGTPEFWMHRVAGFVNAGV